jgi:virulence factor Mce-like protein
MRRELSRATRRLIGLGSTALALIVLALVFQPPTMPWRQPLHLHLQASSFGELNPAAAVYLGGVKVGTVEQIRWQRGQPTLDLSIDSAYRSRIHGDASAMIRPHGLLGPEYVDLDGGRSGSMADGGTIPRSRVKVAVQLDEVLNTLQPDVRDDLKTFLVELSKGSDGRGDDVNAALKDLGQSHQQLQVVADTIQVRDQDLADFFVYSEQLNRDIQYAPIDAQIADTDPVLQGLVNVEDSMGAGIDHTAGTLQELDVVMNGNQQNLAYILQNLAPNMVRLRTAVAAGDRLVVGVNPSLPSLMTAVMETKSSFSYSDANGHYVKVMSITGPCTVGAPAGCGTPSGEVTNPGGAPSAQQSQTSAKSDQQLIQALLGTG